MNRADLAEGVMGIHPKGVTELKAKRLGNKLSLS